MKYLDKLYFKENENPGRFILIEGMNGSGKTTKAKALLGWLQKKNIKAIYNKEPTSEYFGRLMRDLIDHKPLDRILLSRLKDIVLDSECVEELKGESKLDIFHINNFNFCERLLKILDSLMMGEFLSEAQRQTLFTADRLQDVCLNIIPCLKRGEWIIQDRYDLSNYIYGLSGGSNFEYLRSVHHEALNSNYLAADVVIFYWVPPVIGAQRNKAEGKIVDIYETEKSLEKVEKASKKIFDFVKQNPQPGKPIINHFQVTRHRKHPCFIINAEGSFEEVFKETQMILEDYFKV